MRKNAKNNKKGFTLIELIVVVAILVALMLMLVPRLTGFTDEATKTANTANARAIYTAIKASETAKSTGMYGKGDATIKMCGDTVEVYKVFQDDAAPKGTCSYVPEGDYVKYGTGTTEGRYPMPEPEASAGTN